MQVQTSSISTLVRVYATRAGRRTRYMGHFADGSAAVLRVSNNDSYVNVCQVRYTGARHDMFVFSGRPGGNLGTNDRACCVASVAVGLDTSVLR